MRSKSTPILANCAVLLAVLGLSVAVARAGEIRAVAIESNTAVHFRIARVHLDETIDADLTFANHDVIGRGHLDAIHEDIIEGSELAIANPNNVIDKTIIELEITWGDIDKVFLPIELAEAHDIAIASVDDDVSGIHS